MSGRGPLWHVTTLSLATCFLPVYTVACSTCRIQVSFCFILRWWRRWDCGRSGSLAYSMWTVKATSLGSNSIRRYQQNTLSLLLPPYLPPLSLIYYHITSLFCIPVCFPVSVCYLSGICLKAPLWPGASDVLFYQASSLARANTPSSLCVSVCFLTENPPHTQQVCVRERQTERGAGFVEALQPL